ncbi:MAG: glycosyltransferase, partial [Anaerolineales bacterium]|nr:glycosyltransferase [Anaerolineales bacterium]
MAVLLVGASLHDEDAAEFHRQAKGADLENAIVDLGWIEEQDLPATLSSADVGLYLMDDTLLNRTKCPVKLADMLSMGVPVVGESVGQIPEYIIHDRTGLLLDHGDEVGTAAAVVKLLQDKEERHRLGKAAQTHIRNHFNWFKLATDLAQIYINIDVGTKPSNSNDFVTGP